MFFTFFFFLSFFLIWVIVRERAKWQGKQNAKKQHWVSCPGRAIITMDPIQPKIASLSISGSAAVEASPDTRGAPDGQPQDTLQPPKAGVCWAVDTVSWHPFLPQCDCYCPNGMDGLLPCLCSFWYLFLPPILAWAFFFSLRSPSFRRGHHAASPWDILLFSLMFSPSHVLRTEF